MYVKKILSESSGFFILCLVLKKVIEINFVLLDQIITNYQNITKYIYTKVLFSLIFLNDHFNIMNFEFINLKFINL
jgi:hypothetical protein